MIDPVHELAMAKLHKKLELLGDFLNDEFLRGHIFREADVVLAIVQYLRNQLTTDYEFWCVGTQHYLGGVTPDIVCYYSQAPSLPTDFVAHREAYAIAAIEVKFGRLGRDLEKLKALQSSLASTIGRKILIWNVYGDHYNPEIHEKYCANHINFENEMRAWKEEESEFRGFTSMKCGVHSEYETVAAKERRELLNAMVWVLGKRSKYRTKV